MFEPITKIRTMLIRGAEFVTQEHKPSLPVTVGFNRHPSQHIRLDPTWFHGELAGIIPVEFHLLEPSEDGTCVMLQLPTRTPSWMRGMLRHPEAQNDQATDRNVKTVRRDETGMTWAMMALTAGYHANLVIGTDENRAHRVQLLIEII